MNSVLRACVGISRVYSEVGRNVNQYSSSGYIDTSDLVVLTKMHLPTRAYLLRYTHCAACIMHAIFTRISTTNGIGASMKVPFASYVMHPMVTRVFKHQIKSI